MKPEAPVPLDDARPEQRANLLPVIGSFPEPCLHCFGEIAPGDRVVTRRLIDENATFEPGQRGRTRPGLTAVWRQIVMRISFDLDDTLICYGDDVECEPGLAWWARMVLRDEPLREGTRRLAVELRARGHSLWVYTSSGRTVRLIKWWLRLHGVRVEGVVNGRMHVQCFGADSSPSKRPHAFKIALHIDNSQGVAVEGERHGFNVCVIEPSAKDWVEQVLAAVERQFANCTGAA